LGDEREVSPGRHRLHFALAVIFAAAMVVYSVAWMYYIRQNPHTTLGGIRATSNPVEHELVITEVTPRSQGAQAGVSIGDRIVSLNGREVRWEEPFVTLLTRGQKGDHAVVEIRKANSGELLTLDLVLDWLPQSMGKRFTGQRIVEEIVSSFPALFVLVALPVLFLRLDDRNAWMLAICSASFIACAPIGSHAGLMPVPLRAFVLSYMVLFFPLMPASFYWLFATFPAQSPIDRRLPWLKKVLFFGVGVLSLSAAGVVLFTHSLDALWPVGDFIDGWKLSYAVWVYFFGSIGLALASLVWNSVSTRDTEARRKTRVIVWGTVVAIVPWLGVNLFASINKVDEYSLPFWLWGTTVMLILLFPLSIAYAVLKHRVLDVPVLLRRSARYLLVQRGFLILIFVLGVGATLALAESFSRHYPEESQAAIPVGAAFGVMLVFGGARIQRQVSRRVDKAFFRSAYDTRQILESLLPKTQQVRTHEQLSQLLAVNIEDALHPSFLLVYFRENGQQTLSGDINAEMPPERILDSPSLTEFFASGKPVEILPTGEQRYFAQLGVECLVPISGRAGEPLGLLLLGPRLSEEPYSREDRRLLALVASSAAGALENISLAEDIAQRMEREKRAAHEIELARQVQRKLFPQSLPKLAHLDFAGECVQARVVGGDYYDFIELAPGVVGFALADISGKGFPAALLMANLQANLRSQYSLALQDMPAVLRSVNRLFCENSEPQNYATAFFCTFDDSTRRLRYVNCGHNPPLLLRAGGAIERLPATATVMGLFDDWDCEVEEKQLLPGDLFLIYTDGVTEASVPGGEEYGEERLIELLRRHRQLSAAELLHKIVDVIEQFSPGEKADDLTVVTGKVR
jgi:sigma-B regulation protein RsbU (phosphoserine phosphatase)